jgi:predicted 3-demethylubiquinone-9 3-methyltransferase (glyoxalase superfamily)
MQKIVPHLWYDKEAKIAAEFYVSVFGDDSKVKNVSTITGTPSGDCDIVSFHLRGHEFMAISAGPYFKFTPAISFMVNFDPSKNANARAEIDALWAKLSEGGSPLMPLDKYPFSERYGWVKDKFGLTWQLILTDPAGEERPFIVPTLLYVTEGCDKAEEATNYYLSVFGDSKRGIIARYPAGMEPNREGAIMFTDFTLLGQWFAAMDASAEMHKFTFSEAVSFIVKCDTQEEIDHYWEKLSAVPEAEQCGWLKDKYGVSWQITPRAMDAMMASGDKEKMMRVTQAFLKMKKFDIAELERAADGVVV